MKPEPPVTRTFNGLRLGASARQGWACIGSPEWFAADGSSERCTPQSRRVRRCPYVRFGPGGRPGPRSRAANYRSGMTSPAILARGHWPAERVRATWREEHYEPPEEHADAADAAIEALRERGSPSHDGLAARLVGHAEEGDVLTLELQPVRWALR